MFLFFIGAEMLRWLSQDKMNEKNLRLQKKKKNSRKFAFEVITSQVFQSISSLLQNFSEKFSNFQNI
jgi:hypothetical protein